MFASDGGCGTRATYHAIDRAALRRDVNAYRGIKRAGVTRRFAAPTNTALNFAVRLLTSRNAGGAAHRRNRIATCAPTHLHATWRTLWWHTHLYRQQRMVAYDGASGG